MQIKIPPTALALLAIFATLSSGCAQFDSTKTYVRDSMAAPAGEILSPVSQKSVFRTPAVPAEQALAAASEFGIKVLMSTLSESLSFSAPITVHALTSLNPEIQNNNNNLGRVVARQLRAALVAEEYTVAGSGSLFENTVSLHGTYKQRGKTLTVSLKLTDSEGAHILGETEYTLPIDGALRRIIDGEYATE